MRYHHFGDGQYLLRLDPGDELVGSLEALAAEAHIEAGHGRGLGSVSGITLGFLDPETGEYSKRRFDESMEVAQLTVTFSMHGDRPHVHVHAVVAPRELLAYAGHVHEATVGTVMEIFVSRLGGRLERLPVPGLPFPSLFLPGEEPPEDDDSAQ